MGILDKFKNKKEAPADKAKDLPVEKKVKEEKEKKEPKGEILVNKDAMIGKFQGILVRPIVSEKNSGLTKLNQYVFEISPKANKIMVAEAVKAKYGVTPIRVNIANILGKKVRSGRKLGKKKDVKKAIVFLPEGKNINVYEGA